MDEQRNCRAGLFSRIVIAAAMAFGITNAFGSSAQPEADTAIALDGSAGGNKRVQSIERLAAAVAAGQADRSAARETFKQVLWKGGAPPPVRLAALAGLFADESPEGQADNRKFLRLRLPTESQWPVITAMCAQIQQRAKAGDQSWREVTPALVRSYARVVPVPPDPDRPERSALLALHPDRTIEQIAFDVYLTPAGMLSGTDAPAADLIERQRQAAWELLARFDPDGSTRRDLLASAPAGDPALIPISRAASELRVVPVTGSELAWVKGLLESDDPGAASWWAAAQGAVAGLTDEQAAGLQLRHIEPARWARSHRPEWLSVDRASLLSELRSRLEPRRKWRKTQGLGPEELMSREMLSDWQDRLVFGDLLTILVIDEAMKDQRVIDSLFKQAAADRADTTTEYGGVLFATDAVPVSVVPGGTLKPRWDLDAASPGFVAQGYSARPGQRVNDRTFVAPEDMFTVDGAGGRALAHFHFHAQTVNNAEYAGPGRGDFEYANTHGRACVVFTTVRKGVLNADYYQRTSTTGSASGVVIDLGEVASGK